MFAVFESGGKQHRVSEGETVRLERLKAGLGETVEFDRVMLVAEGDRVAVGKPFVDGGKVLAEVLGHDRRKKIGIVKFRRRQNYVRHAGHRQWYTEVRITGING